LLSFGKREALNAGEHLEGTTEKGEKVKKKKKKDFHNVCCEATISRWEGN